MLRRAHHPDPLRPGRERDPIGHRVHVGLACLWAFLIPMGTAPPNFIFVALLIYAALRIWATHGAYEPFVHHRMFVLCIAWFAWCALSLMWSSSVDAGFDELRVFRLHIPLLFGLWPVIDRQRAIVWALVAGACAAAIAQMLQRSGFEFGWYDPLAPGRYPGFVHPASTGVVQMVAATLALAFLRADRPWERVIAMAAVGLCAIGLLLGGSRSTWLAAAVAWPAALTVVAWRTGTTPSHRRRPLWAGAGLVVAVAASVPILAPVVGPRIEQAASDLRLAFVEENFDSHTGARLAQWPISLRLWRDRPIVGHGLGSYVPEAFARFRPDEPVPEYPRLPGEPRPDRTGPPVLPHPHSAWLHALAMTGLVGAGLCALIWWQVLVNAQRATLRLSPVAPALVPAVLGLFIAFVLDSHHLSAPGTSVLMLVIGLSWPRPTGLAEADSA